MKKLFATFLVKYTFQHQLGVTIAIGIFLLALCSSVVGSWQGNLRVRSNLVSQGLRITDSLARQSTLGLVYASDENVSEAVNATLEFPGVVSVEIRDAKQQVLLMRGNFDPDDKWKPVSTAVAGTDPSGATQAATLNAESPNAWRFVAPVYSQPNSTPFDEIIAPELLGQVTVEVSKAALTQMTAEIFAANLITSFSFALLFLLLIRF